MDVFSDKTIVVKTSSRIHAQHFFTDILSFNRITKTQALGVSLKPPYMRPSSIKFFHLSLRSLRRMQQRDVAGRFILSLGSHPRQLNFSRWFSEKVVARMRENNTADMPSARIALLITETRPRIINGPLAWYSLPPISIRLQILFVLSFHAVNVNRILCARLQYECRLQYPTCHL